MSDRFPVNVVIMFCNENIIGRGLEIKHNCSNTNI